MEKSKIMVIGREEKFGNLEDRPRRSAFNYSGMQLQENGKQEGEIN